MNDREIQALIQGFLDSDSTVKNLLKNSLPLYLGLKNGKNPLFFTWGLRVYFQSNLSKRKLGVDKADKFYLSLKAYKADIGILVAASGYALSFRERLFQQPDIENIAIHLLTLEDILAKNDTFEAAIKDLQPREEQSQ